MWKKRQANFQRSDTNKVARVKRRRTALLVVSLVIALAVVQQSLQNLQNALEQSRAMTSTSSPARAFVYVMIGSGLCSQILNLAAQAVFLEETEHRQIMVDESVYPEHRRHNKSVRVLTASFTPQFTVFQKRPDNHEALEQLRPGLDYALERRQVVKVEKQWADEDKTTPLYVTYVFSMRDEIMKHYRIFLANTHAYLPAFLTGSQRFYDKMANFMCPNFQFNEGTQTEIAQYKQERNIPLQLEGTTSVAFHIRRGDKIKHMVGCNESPPKSLRGLYRHWKKIVQPEGESRCFPADAYVQKFLSVAPNHKKTVEHCFVASDDYQAVEEMKEALTRHKVPCQVHTLTEPEQRGRSQLLAEQNDGDKETIQFFSELSLMIDATYFVGTFNSNVGSFVSVMRGCDNDRDRKHYSQSYGVDRDAFYLI